MSVPDREALWTGVETTLAGLAIEQAPALPPEAKGSVRRELVHTRLGDIAAWCVGDGAELDVEVPVPAVGSGGQPAPRPGRRRVRLDLPGHGASDALPAGPIDTDALTGALVDVIDRFDPDAPLHLSGRGAAAGLTVACAASLGDRVVGVELNAPWLLTGAERRHLLDHLPDLTPRPAGGHLLEAWQWERERRLFPPWAEPAGHRRIVDDAPDPAEVHANCVELIRLGQRLREFLAAALPPDTLQRLDNLPVAPVVEAPLGGAAA